MKDGLTLDEGEEGLNGKGPITLGLSDGRQNSGELLKETRIGRLEVLLNKEKKEGGEQPKGEALGLHQLSYSTVQSQSF